MSRPPAHTVHTLCAALVLAIALPAFAQQKPPSLVGVTREQVVAKLGEPKSNLKAGAREVLFFARIKLTLRNGVVIESEELPEESAPKRASDTAPAATGPAANSGTPPVAAPSPAAPPISEGGGQPAARSTPVAEPVAAIPVQPSSSRETRLEIKSVKSSPSSAKSAPRPAASTPSAPVVATDSKPLPQAPPATPPPAVGTTTVVGATRPAVMPDAVHPTVVEEISVTEAAPVKLTVDPKKKAAVRRRWQSRLEAEADDEEPVRIFSTQSYVIAAIVMLGGIGYLWWRRGQRNLEMAATAVSRAPFEPEAAIDRAGQFTTDLIGKLGAKRFERLVASYYAKTGVVAERTNVAPGTPVHIKIFWKGEPKPFAGVQCHANPPALIGPKPLQELFEALSAAEIRRGYIVTTGKFNVEARDYAEEKHFTLLSGDLFLEKLNALPPAARGELLKETNTEEPMVPAPGGAAN